MPNESVSKAVPVETKDIEIPVRKYPAPFQRVTKHFGIRTVTWCIGELPDSWVVSSTVHWLETGGGQQGPMVGYDNIARLAIDGDMPIEQPLCLLPGSDYDNAPRATGEAS